MIEGADRRRAGWTAIGFLATSVFCLAALTALRAALYSELAEPGAQILPRTLAAGNFWIAFLAAPWPYYVLIAAAPGIAGGVGGYFLPRLLGSRRHAWPVLYASSYCVFLISIAVLAVGTWVDVDAAAFLALHLAALSSILAGALLLASFIVIRSPQPVPGAAGLMPWLSSIGAYAALAGLALFFAVILYRAIFGKRRALQ